MVTLVVGDDDHGGEADYMVLMLVPTVLVLYVDDDSRGSRTRWRRSQRQRRRTSRKRRQGRMNA